MIFISRGNLAYNKTLLKILRLITFLFSFAASFFIAVHMVFAGSIGAVSTEVASVYREPSFEAEITDQFEEGEILDIISIENNWIFFNSDIGNAYMPLNYVTILQAAGLVAQDGASLYQEPSTGSAVVTMVPMGSVVNVIGYNGEFYAVDLGGTSAYMLRSCLIGDLLNYVGEVLPLPERFMAAAHTVTAPAEQTAFQQEEKMYLTVSAESGLNLRVMPSEEAEIFTAIPWGQQLDIVSLSSDWHAVSFNGTMGYVNAQHTMLQYGVVEQAAAENSRITQMIDYAKQFIGTTYKWGGTNLNTGVDCSGFTYSVFKSMGITLNRSSKDQIKNGQRVDKSELAPGDLVFFTTNGSKTRSISHVGIYIGNNEFIHSSSSNSKSKRGIIITNLSDGYYTQRYVGACRVIYD